MHQRNTNNPFTTIIMGTFLCLSFAMAGCSKPTIEATPIVPDQFSFTLYTHSTSQQITYFELSRSGELHYAGGMRALRRDGIPVTHLTPAQRQELWDIIMQAKLHEAPAGPLFPKAKTVNYDFALNTGGFDHLIRAIDDEQPGLKKLHDYLFNLRKSLTEYLPRAEP